MTAHTEYYNSKEAENYYQIASEGNGDFFNSSEYSQIVEYIHSWDHVCEFGCGEWSKIATFSNIDGVKLSGFDISQFAIEKARTQYPTVQFDVKDIAHTELSDGVFDLTLTCFVLEHVDDPRIVVDEMIRTTRKDGHIVLWFPNYGSPLFPSPPTLYRKSFLSKVCTIWKRILSAWFSESPVYKNVDPILDAEFELDYDTIAEIHMWSLVTYLQKKWLTIEFASSRWENINTGSNPLFKFYAPFRLFKNSLCRYWGPQCFIIIKK